MGYQLCNSDFTQYIKELSKSYQIYAPVKQSKKGKFSNTDCVGYGEITSFEDIVLHEKSYFSPKEIFYPIRETLFYFMENKQVTPDINLKPVIIFLRPCDFNGIKRLDTIFLRNGQEVDFYYLRRRELVKFIIIECVDGFDSCFCVSMNANTASDYSGAVRFNENSIELDIEDTSLATESLNSLPKVDFDLAFIQENKTKVNIPDVSLVTKEHFNHPIWTEYTARCIACGRCNTSCITCSCFSMQDSPISDDKKIGERRRVWAGCHVDGFTNMAGGHQFRLKNGERMRFKTMHKINDYHKRFGEHMCVGCGRCDDVCPEYISFSKCINKLNEITQEVTQND